MFMNDTSGAAPLHASAIRPVPRGTIMLILLALLAPFALYFSTVASIVKIWDSSETFAHGYVILPISLWLIWRRRANFSALPPTPYWPALVVVALLGMGWLAAHIGEVQVITQYMFEDGAEEYNELIVVRGIPVYSHCEHHLAPFFGEVILVGHGEAFADFLIAASI